MKDFRLEINNGMVSAACLTENLSDQTNQGTGLTLSSNSFEDSARAQSQACTEEEEEDQQQRSYSIVVQSV